MTDAAAASFNRVQWITLALAVLLLAYGLRIWHVDSESIWHDEAWSIRAIHGPFTTPDDNTPVLYYLSGHLLWRLGAGDTPLALRYISVLFGTLAVAVAMRLGRAWVGRFAAVAFGITVAASPLLWEYAQEVRAYVVIPMLALLMIGGAARLLQIPVSSVVRLRLWLFLFITELVALYTHNLSVPLIVWLNIALGIAWLLRTEWRRILTWAMLQIGLVILYIPWLLTQSRSGTSLNNPPQPGLSLVRDIWAAYFLPALPQLEESRTGLSDLPILINVIDVLGILCAGLVGTALLQTLTRHRNDQRLLIRGWLLLSHALLVPALSTALILIARIDFHPRYFIAALPGTLLLVIFALHIIQRHLVYRNLIMIGTGILTAAIVIVSALSLHQITTTRHYEHDDFAGLAAYYDSLPQDAVIVLPFDDEPALQYYFDRVLDIDAAFVNIPLYADEATAVEALNALDAGRVELLTWFQLPADPRGMYPCLLTAASTAAPGKHQTYFGLMTQRFTVDEVDMQPIDVSPPYPLVTLEDAAYAASAWGACVRTDWQLTDPLASDFQVAMMVLNAIDRPIAASDVPIARPDNTGTAHWDAGESGQAYNLLQLPAGAPPDDYGLQMTVYSASHPSGLDVLDVRGNPTGMVYTLADGVLLAGPPLVDVPAEPQLVQDNLDDDTLLTGTALEVELLLATGAETHELVLAGEDWSQTQPLPTLETPLRTWMRFVVPPGNSGPAVLHIGEVALAQYNVVDPERSFENPALSLSVDVTLPGVAKLVGAEVQSLEVSSTSPPQVTLAWRSEGQVDTSYTIFVQLLSADGHVLAQSDSKPVSGARPTTGWVEGEYILDRHTLRFNITNYSGSATLIVGMYDAEGGFRRVMAANGADFITLPVEVMVKPA